MSQFIFTRYLSVVLVDVNLKFNRRYYYIVIIFTARKRSLGQGNIFAPVCHSVPRGVYLPRGCTYTPWAGTPLPLGRYTPPPRQVHPPGHVHPSPGQVHPQQAHPRAGTPPWSFCWRYASYWILVYKYNRF